MLRQSQSTATASASVMKCNNLKKKKGFKDINILKRIIVILVRKEE